MSSEVFALCEIKFGFLQPRPLFDGQEIYDSSIWQANRLKEFVLRLGLGRKCDSEAKDLEMEQLDESTKGNGKGPITRYQACVNLPSIARYSQSGQLSQDFTAEFETYTKPNTTELQLQRLASTVTDCLSSTCRHSRRPDLCYDNLCSPVRLLTTSSSPNVTAIDQCLKTLCSGGFNSLPFADADIVGIGVYASYILQCIFVAAFCIGSLLPLLWRFLHTKNFKRSKKSKSSERKISLLNEFHKAQCFFSITLMIASFTQNIYDTNMLITFMLVPLSTNGIVPIVFAYLLLVYNHKDHIGTTLYTLLTYVLASVVYWSLYAHVTSSSEDRPRLAYQQFMFKLSAIPACGEYSALAVCPHYPNTGLEEVYRASRRIRVLTPIIWTFSTIVLFVVLAYQTLRASPWRKEPEYTYQHPSQTNEGKPNPPEHEHNQAHEEQASPDKKPMGRTWRLSFIIMTAAMVACLGMQLSLLAIGKSLNMMNPHDWSFGQIIAITIWAPPIVEYVYKEFEVWQRRGGTAGSSNGDRK
ncbi:hypothetical protein FKW77_006818 [Venturia effusa]|uniref:Uncharacterized protein n=1 Tax=Venturia effusa TaxID=50376 RepID=A0A517LCI3_9PEZI|nr:hypothetical protein FKW77_006818 [Venturia effusa]